MRCSSEPVRDRIDPQGTHFSFLPPKQLAVSRLRLNDGLTVDDSRTGSHHLAAAEPRRPRHGGTVQSIVVRGRHRGPDTGCSALGIASSRSSISDDVVHAPSGVALFVPW